MGLIELTDILLELLPSHKLPSDHFQRHIDVLLKAFECEPTIQKQSVNSLIGVFGRTKTQSCKTKFTLDRLEASRWWGDKDPLAEVFIQTVETEQGKFYKGIFSQPIETEETKYPIYKQILEMEALELHKLEQRIQSGGGRVLDRNTDAIRYCCRHELDIQDFWDAEHTKPKYQREEPKPLDSGKLSGMVREHTLDVGKFELNWTIQYDYEGEAEEEARAIIDRKTSIHIDGRAGCGKTHLVNCIRAEMDARELNYMAFSPTNKGARLIQGHTIHSLFYKFKRMKKALFGKLKKVDYIFIDEVSMMVKDFYQLFVLIKRAFPGIKFIIAGDFGQLPPVNDSWTGDYENSPAMFSLCDGQRIQLTVCRRADRELFDLCANVETVRVENFPQTHLTLRNLAYTHETRKAINERCMKEVLPLLKGARVVIPASQRNCKTQEVTLMAGMPLIAHTNFKKLNILNSQKFQVKKVTSNVLTIGGDDGVFEIPVKDFHRFFYLGYCITIHASQGETFDDKYTIYDWGHYCFSKKAKYVALSRGTNINNIQIVR